MNVSSRCVHKTQYHRVSGVRIEAIMIPRRNNGKKSIC